MLKNRFLALISFLFPNVEPISYKGEAFPPNSTIYNNMFRSRSHSPSQPYLQKSYTETSTVKLKLYHNHSKQNKYYASCQIRVDFKLTLLSPKLLQTMFEKPEDLSLILGTEYGRIHNHSSLCNTPTTRKGVVFK